MIKKFTKKEQQQINYIKKSILELHEELSKTVGVYGATMIVLKIPFEILKANGTPQANGKKAR